MDFGARLGVISLILDLVPMAVSSVLSLFIFNILSLILSATSAIQSFTMNKSWEVRGNTRVVELEIICKKWCKWPAERLCVQIK